MIPSCIKEEDFRYSMLPPMKFCEFYQEFMDLLEDFSLTVKQCGELEVVTPIIGKICLRVDQRKDYYMYYHSTDGKVMHMSKEKELALWAYWINKYQPVVFKEKKDADMFFDVNGCTVSNAFAAYVIISTVCANVETKVTYFSDSVVADMYYDLANRDFSKEAIISKVSDLINS